MIPVNQSGSPSAAAVFPRRARPSFAAGRKSRHGPRLGIKAPTFVGMLAATLMFSASLAPGLIPLSWLLQGVISGVWMAIGYGFGTGIGTLGALIVRLRPGHAFQRGAWLVLGVGGGASGSWAWVMHRQWQADVRILMGMPAAALPELLAPVVVAALVALALVLVARLFRGSYRLLLRGVSVYLPRWMAHVVAIATSVVLLVSFLTEVVGDRVVPAIDRHFLAQMNEVDGTVQPPTSPLRSGGDASLVAWETLGAYGRDFVADGPTVEELSRFSGVAAIEPIRVYVGRQSAASAEQRARLALAELERTGAFRRAVLVIVNPTGTGWVDPLAVAPIEYMYNGNTAAVVTQYSYLPSWAVMIGNQDHATEAAHHLFRAIHARLQQEPAATRPRLLIYGQSLGAFAAESVFASLDDVTARTDGILLVGPPRASRLWRELVSQRDPGSPVWRPVYQHGATVRFGADLASLAAPQALWREPRLVYLQHASDPISWWTPELLWERPEWLDGRRGPDVSSAMHYYPVATFLRVTVDLFVGLGAPPGHGHHFRESQAEAWTLIVPPAHWSAHDTQRLIVALTSDA